METGERRHYSFDDRRCTTYFYSITFHSDGTYSGRAYGNEMGGNYVYNGNGIKNIDGDYSDNQYFKFRINIK